MWGDEVAAVSPEFRHCHSRFTHVHSASRRLEHEFSGEQLSPDLLTIWKNRDALRASDEFARTLADRWNALSGAGVRLRFPKCD